MKVCGQCFMWWKASVSGYHKESLIVEGVYNREDVSVFSRDMHPEWLAQIVVWLSDSYLCQHVRVVWPNLLYLWYWIFELDQEEYGCQEKWFEFLFWPWFLEKKKTIVFIKRTRKPICWIVWRRRTGSLIKT